MRGFKIMENKNQEYVDKIDFSYIRNIIDKNPGKKVFCFGAGTAAEILMNSINIEISIEKFLDNNSLLHGSKIKGIEIVDSKILLGEEKGKYIVLILSRHVYAISSQLNGYGLQPEQDYYDIYKKFLPYFMIKKHISLMHEFQNFIKRIPSCELKNRPIYHNSRIGVVYVSSMYANYTSYCLAKVLLLRYYGYNVSLIIDTLPTFESYYLFEGFERVIREQIDKLVNIIQDKCNDIEIFYIEQEGKQELDFDDIEAVRENKRATLVWDDSVKEYGFLTGEEKRENIAEEILVNTLMYIKAFFNKHRFETINVLGGKGNHLGNYVYYGKKLGIRVSSYDVVSPQELIYSTDGVAAHSEDITKLINRNYFNIQEKKELLLLAKDNFIKRINKTVNDKGYNFQTAGYKNEIKPYDIVIPLNIFWDAAALYRDRIFYNYINWLSETLEFIIENTDASVLIREHPAQNVFIYENYINLKEEISIITEYKDRIFYAVASEKLNIYQYIEQCKLVLPFTSTVGIEAVIMGKNVITHTDVYYNDIDIVYKAHDKNEYFNKIIYYLEHTGLSKNINVDNAYLAFFYQMNNFLECEYCIYNTSWMKMSLSELSKIRGVDWIIAAVGSGIPVIYLVIKDKYFKIK